MTSSTGGVVRIGNCSGFYGDRLSAMREMLEGGELDVLTGDYLAELTLLILGRQRMKDSGAGWARTFLTQLEECLGRALERGVRIVANAGGLHPAGLAAAVTELGQRLGVPVRVATVAGDDLLPRLGELDVRAGLRPPGDAPVRATCSRNSSIWRGPCAVPTISGERPLKKSLDWNWRLRRRRPARSRLESFFLTALATRSSSINPQRSTAIRRHGRPAIEPSWLTRFVHDLF